MSLFSDLHIYAGRDGIAARPQLRRIGFDDVFAALREGWDDFLAMPSHLAFLGFFYCLAGLALSYFSSLNGALHLIFPLASGFAIVGPLVAIGLYQMSRRRERGLPTNWVDAFAVLRSPALPAIAALGLILVALFGAWIASAHALYVWLYGPAPPASATSFLMDIATSGRGHLLIVLGGLIGFVYAALALCLSVISFPLLLDRDVGLVVAVGASLRFARENPLEIALWGLIVACGLILGSLPLFVGLAIVMPVLGHATWRLYRRAVVREPGEECALEWPSERMGHPARFYSTPHSVLFPLPERTSPPANDSEAR